MFTNSPLLVMDWGIGGLSVYRELKRHSPARPVVYLSDSGRTPYGLMPARDLAARLEELIVLARKRFGVGQTLIACNAASTVIPLLRVKEVSGVIEPGLSLVRECGRKMIGVIGGRRTIESRIFSSSLPGFTVVEQVAQPLSALVEEGVLRGPRVEAALAEILPPLRGVEALLLACTHYPALAPAIRDALPGAVLLDPAEAAALTVPSSPGERSRDLFFTTGDREAMKRSARLAFAVDCAPEAWGNP